MGPRFVLYISFNSVLVSMNEEDPETSGGCVEESYPSVNLLQKKLIIKMI